jgi:hypothetical protein
MKFIMCYTITTHTSFIDQSTIPMSILVIYQMLCINSTLAQYLKGAVNPGAYAVLCCYVFAIVVAIIYCMSLTAIGMNKFHSAFSPDFPASSPWVTSVGATQVSSNLFTTPTTTAAATT